MYEAPYGQSLLIDYQLSPVSKFIPKAEGKTNRSRSDCGKAVKFPMAQTKNREN